MTLVFETPPPTSSATSASPRAAAPAPPADAVRRARGGDVAAFEALYRAHVGRVHAVCLRLHGGRREDAEDSVQEAFVRAWRQLPRFRGESAFSTWLHRIAVNTALDRLRTDRRRADLGDLAAEGEAGPAGGPRSTPAPIPGARLDLERAVAGLPPGARLAFVLHDVEGFKHREIAEMTGTAEGTWKSQVHRARRLLREALER